MESSVDSTMVLSLQSSTGFRHRSSIESTPVSGLQFSTGLPTSFRYWIDTGFMSAIRYWGPYIGTMSFRLYKLCRSSVGIQYWKTDIGTMSFRSSLSDNPSWEETLFSISKTKTTRNFLSSLRKDCVWIARRGKSYKKCGTTNDHSRSHDETEDSWRNIRRRIISAIVDLIYDECGGSKASKWILANYGGSSWFLSL